MKRLVFLLSVFGFLLFYKTKGQLVPIYPVEDSPDSDIDAISDERDRSFTSQELRDIQTLAKNISHSKGHIIQDKDGDPEFRRSYERKVRLKMKLSVLKRFSRQFNTSGEFTAVQLEELEEMVHEYETAIEFMKLGGIEFLLSLINLKNPKVCRSALSVLTAALQSNPTVQKYAESLKLLDYIFSLLRITNINYDRSVIKVRNTALYTLSTLIRNNPTSQLKFYRQGGLTVLAGVLKSNQDSMKSKMKVLDLIDDLAHEVHPQVPHGSPKVLEQLKGAYVTGYSNSNLCNVIPRYLDYDDLYIHEKTIYAMIAVADGVCFKNFKRPHILKIIKYMIHKYDDSNIYYRWMENTDMVYRRHAIMHDFRDLYHMLIRKKKMLSCI